MNNAKEYYMTQVSGNLQKSEINQEHHLVLFYNYHK